MDIGDVGIWWNRSWQVYDEPELQVAAELERLGYGAIWSSGGFNAGLAPHFEQLLASSDGIVVASGIVSIWKADPQTVSDAVADLEEKYPDRFLLGIGASHATLADDYTHPYRRMVEYLDNLDGAERTVPKERRLLAALGPKMLALAAERAVGAHPYFSPVEHTARARVALGAGPLLAPELAVVLEKDPATARALARKYMSRYLQLPNYTNNLETFGFEDRDFTDGGSDALVDAIVGWGSVDAVARRVQEHLDAGADHVCVQIVSPLKDFPIALYRELAPAVVS